MSTQTQALNGTESLPVFMASTEAQAQSGAPIKIPVAKQPLATDEEYALVGLPPEGAIRALKLFCQHNLRGTPFLPQSIVRNLDENAVAGTLMAVMLTGREMGFTPMQCLRVFWMSPDGRLGMYADGMMALMLKAGAKFKWVYLENDGAELHTTRRDGNEYVAKFMWPDADMAGLIAKNNSLYKKYPRRMFKARVIGETFNTLYSDLGGGQMYTQEELLDIQDDAAGNWTPRQMADAAADADAEKDPGLSIVPKTATRSEVIEVKAEPPTNASESPQHPRTATPVHNQKKTSAKPEETTKPKHAESPKDATPSEPTAQSVYHDLKDNVMDAYEGITIKDNFVPCCKGYFGELPRQEAAYLPFLRLLLEVKDNDQAQELMRKDPLQLGRNIKVAEAMPAPSAEAPKDAPAPEPEKEPEPSEPMPDAENQESPAAVKETADPPFDVLAEPNDAYAQTFTGWNRETRDIARQVFQAIEREHRTPPTQYINGCKSFKINLLPDDQAQAMLLLIAHNRTDAFSLFKKATEKQMPLTAVLQLVAEKAGHGLTVQNTSSKTKSAVTSVLTEVQSA